MKLISIVITFLVWCQAVNAETIELSEELMPCVTSVNKQGHIFTGMFGFVYSPKPYTWLGHNDVNLSIYGDLSIDSGTLLFGGVNYGVFHEGGAQRSVEKNKHRTEITFGTENDHIVHQCYIEFINFDASKHNLDMIRRGNCDFQKSDDGSYNDRLTLGIIQKFKLPPSFAEGSSSSTEIVDNYSTSNGIVLFPKKQGVISYYWLKRSFSFENETAPEQEINICPFDVVSPAETEKTTGKSVLPTCANIFGEVAPLSVGQNLTMSIPENTDLLFTQSRDAVVANDEVAEIIAVDLKSKTLSLRAKANGVTSVYVNVNREVGPTICEIVVR